MGKAGVWAGLVMLVFAGIVFSESSKLDYSSPIGLGPGFFPYWLSLAMIVLSIVYIIGSLKNSVDFKAVLPKAGERLDFIVVIGSMALFVAIVNWTGFVIAASATLIVLMLRSFKWYTNVILSVSISVAMFMLFDMVLGMPLPVNGWGW